MTEWEWVRAGMAILGGLLFGKLWTNRSELKAIPLILLGGGPGAYVRAMGILALALPAIHGLLVYGPPLMAWGWTTLVMGTATNIWLLPFAEAIEASQAADAGGGPTGSRGGPMVPAVIKAQALLVYLLFVAVVPFIVREEERKYRRGVRGWRHAASRSLKFGVMHMIVGIPIAGALVLAGVSGAFAWRYHQTLAEWLAGGDSLEEAMDAGVLAASQDHAAFNVLILTTVTFGILLL